MRLSNLYTAQFGTDAGRMAVFFAVACSVPMENNDTPDVRFLIEAGLLKPLGPSRLQMTELGRDLLARARRGEK